ncbi:MAG: PfkB family carbohydrate kinase [Culicoidibacterales bacterium]
MEPKILGFGELLLRLNPPHYQKIRQTSTFQAYYGGAEANVIMSLSCFGHQTKFISKVPTHQIGTCAIQQLASIGIDTSGIQQSDGRLGIYFLEQGHGARTSEVIYDRSHSCFSQAEVTDFNYHDILDDVTHVCLSGITPALSSTVAKSCYQLILEAKQRKIFVSYDSNYRSKLWTHREAKQFLEIILPLVDTIFLSVADFQYILEYDIPEGTTTEQLTQLYQQLLEKYPNIRYAAATKRTVHSMSENSLQALLYTDGKLYKSPEQRFQILDRVGGGDAFTAGILHGILSELSPQETVEFANSASILKHSIVGDINFVTRDDVEAFRQYGTQTIKR